MSARRWALIAAFVTCGACADVPSAPEVPELPGVPELPALTPGGPPRGISYTVPSGDHASAEPGLYLRPIGPPPGDDFVLTSRIASAAVLWSPDGERFAFLSGNDLYVSGTLGLTNIYNLRRAPSNDQYYVPEAWSPDGSRILFAFRPQPWLSVEYRTVRPDGSDERPFETDLEDPGEACPGMVLSPDWSWMACMEDGAIEIFIMPVEAPEHARTVLSYDDIRPGDGASDLAWSPDGTRLAFSVGYQYDRGLAIVDIRTGRTSVIYREDGYEVLDPVWSPDGEWILFTYTWLDAASAWRSEVRKIRPDGRALTIVESPAAFGSWRP